MHVLVRSLVVLFLTHAAAGQPRFAESADNIRINALAIESNSLPEADRDQIIRLFQQKTYCQNEISERIRGALTNLGYFKAVVDEPRFSYLTQVEGGRGADVLVRAEPGGQYRIGQIHFQKVTIFSPVELRNLFPLQSGDLFNTTKIGEGLEDMRELYGTRGYINVVAVPEIVNDEARHIVDLIVEVDEGRPYDFGKLYLEGVEPHPGAGEALLNSWKPLLGKRYNSLELQHWLTANHSDWKVGTRISDSIRMTEDPESLVVNVKLTQWPD